MNTNMTGFRWFSKTLHPCVLDENTLSIIRVKQCKVCIKNKTQSLLGGEVFGADLQKNSLLVCGCQ